MTFNGDLAHQLTALCSAAGKIASDESLTAAVASLESAAVVDLARLATELGRAAERIGLAAAGVISTRSSRAAGHAGLAQQLGHRTAASLIQHVTGSTRTEASRQIRVGESLFDEAPIRTDHLADDNAPPVTPPTLWHAPLRTALMSGNLTSAQHDAIRRGLGEPPCSTDADADVDVDVDTVGVSTDTVGQAAVKAWALAAESLIAEAEHVTVEELTKQARAIRDLLDPNGAETRYLERYEARSFRMWTDQDGLTHGSFTFDDESAAWLRTVIDTALRPRRGGPRFVDPAQQAAAQNLAHDPRTNEQLAHDLLLDVIKAGTVADAATVLGARQPGVRIVQIVNRSNLITRLEDDGTTLPSAVAEQQQCNTGRVPVTVDEHSNPLNVGREQRLYTSKQRIALAIRDGGCRWTGCDRPASYCEAHHIDEWSADHGRTDIDRGILLCRFHHTQLHHGRWKITRSGLEEFELHRPPGKTLPWTDTARDESSTIKLRAPLLLRYGWQQATTPPKRFHQAA